VGDACTNWPDTPQQQIATSQTFDIMCTSLLALTDTDGILNY